MKTTQWLLFMLCLVALGLAACNVLVQPVPRQATVLPSQSIEFPKIDRHPAPGNWYRGAPRALPTYNPDSDAVGQMDLRAYDLSGLDLSRSSDDLRYATFDDQTVWPPGDRMPKDFDWKRIMELGKNPGLGVRQLRARGITGRGVSIAIVDQPLIVEHKEYADRLRLYEEINVLEDTPSQMHGPAVASLAVGKTVGVAPEANLYYIATWVFDPARGAQQRDFRFLAQAVRRILEINRQLPRDQKIRVPSMSVGWAPNEAGYEEITAAAEEAKAAGMLIVCSSIEQVHGFKFQALGRSPLADPDVFESYEPGLFWAKGFYAGRRFSDSLLVPMDSRTTASPGGVDEYVFYRQGGWSWSIPYIAGIYALAAQVKPSITPDEFWSLALKTGRTIDLKHEGETVVFGPIVDPMALIAALQAK